MMSFNRTELYRFGYSDAAIDSLLALFCYGPSPYATDADLAAVDAGRACLLPAAAPNSNRPRTAKEG